MPAATVSVIVTCFDLGRFLPETLASLEAQTFRDFELLIVDDGSTEAETLALLDRLERSGTRVVHTPNRGLPAARNAGARLTTGRFLCMVDADDLLDARWLEQAVARLEAEPGLAFVSHWLEAFGDEQWQWTPTSCELPALLEANTVNGAALVRRTVFEEVGGFDESFTDGCEDWDFWLSVVGRGHRGAIIPEVLFRYRRRAESMSRQMMRGQNFGALAGRLAQKHRALYAKHAVGVVTLRQARLRELELELFDLELEARSRLGPRLARLEEQASPAQAALERARRLEAERLHAASELARLRGAHEQAVADLARAHELLSQERARLGAELDRLRGAHEQAVADLARTHELLSQERGQLGAELDRLGTELNRVTDELNWKQAALAGSTARIEALLSSASWKVTAPARALIDLMSLVKGKP